LSAGALDGDNIEAHRGAGESPVTSQVESGRSSDASLLVPIHGLAGCHESRGLPESYLDEYETIGVSHDEVDLTTTRTKIAMDGPQTA